MFISRLHLLSLGLCLSILPGCGGGSSNSPTATPTSTPTVTSQSYSAPVAFGAGQSGTLNLKMQGSSVSGDLVVTAPSVAPSPARVPAHAGHEGPHPFESVIPAGSYPLSGTVTATSFSAFGTFPAPLSTFTISGTTPSATVAGRFTLLASEQITEGPIPSS